MVDAGIAKDALRDRDVGHWREVEDQIAIMNLRSSYCHIVDDMKWDEAVDLFVPDGLFKGLKEVRGRPQIREFMIHCATVMTERSWHICYNGAATIHGDEAVGRIGLDYRYVVNGALRLAAGHYDDELVRVDGHWKFRARILTFYFDEVVTPTFGRPTQ